MEPQLPTPEIKEPTFQDKVLKIFLDNLKIMALGILGSGYVGYKEYFEEDKQNAFKIEVIQVVKGDMKDYMDSLLDQRFDYNLKRSLDNPMVWYDALSSDYVKEYAEEKARDIREEVANKLVEMDSIQRDFVTTLGKGMGIRDEDVIPLFQKMMKDFVKRNEARTVTAPF